MNEIYEVYESILFRAPDPSGQAFWAGLLDSGILNITQIISAFANSPEALDVVDPVIRLYEGLFGRVPDYNGLSGWVQAIDNGTYTFNQVVEGFLGSQEAENNFNGGAAINTPIAPANEQAFIYALYEHLLGRTPDPLGFSYWLGVLGKTPTIASEAAVIEGMFNSTEYINDTQNGIISWETTGAENAIAALIKGGVNTNNPPLPTSSDYPNTINNTAFDYVLTTGMDVIPSGYNVTGDLTDFNGVTPTLNSDDQISNVTNLILTDGYGNGTDILPAGIYLSNIQNITLQTAGNAGSYAGITGAWFDTTGVSNLQSVTIISEGAGVDLVKASGTTNVTVEHLNGGTGVPSSESDSTTTTITRGDHHFSFSTSSTQSITITVASEGGGVEVSGGQNVIVTNSGQFGVVVGGDGEGPDAGTAPASSQTGTGSGSLSLPTGNILVNQNAGGYYAGDVDIMGGVNVTLNVTSDSYGGYLDIGNTPDNTGDFLSSGTDPTGTIGQLSYNYVNTNPTGAIVVNDDAEWGGDINTCDNTWITVFGGSSVTIDAAGDAIQVGDPYVVAASNNTTGEITIVDNAPVPWAYSYNYSSDSSSSSGQREDIDVSGGGTGPDGYAVSITTNTANVEVGDYEGVLNSTHNGALAGTQPAGDVIITDTATGDDSYVEVYGGVNVTVIAGVESIDVGYPEFPTNGAPFLLGNSGWTNINSTNFDSEIYDYSGTGSSTTGATLQDGVYVASDDQVAAVTINAVGASILVGYDGNLDNEDPGIAFGPNGDVIVNDIAVIPFDGIINDDPGNIYVFGGDNIYIASNASECIVVGDSDGLAGAMPTGTVNITDTAFDPPGLQYISVFGGTAVNIDTLNGFITVGGGTAASNPTGPVTIHETGIEDGFQYENHIAVASGTDIIIDTTGVTDCRFDSSESGSGSGSDTSALVGSGDAILVGYVPQIAGPIYQYDIATAPTGSISIADSHSGVLYNLNGEDETIQTFGGTTVTIDTNPIGDIYDPAGSINVGELPYDFVENHIINDFFLDPTGNVVINDSAGVTDNAAGNPIWNPDSDTAAYAHPVFGTAPVYVYMNGGATAQITGGEGVYVYDVQSLPTQTHIPVGTSSLTSVSFDGVTGCDNSITDNALTHLTIGDVTPTTNAGFIDVNIYNTHQSTNLEITLANATNVYVDDDGWEGFGPSYTGTLTIDTLGTQLDEIVIDFPLITALVFNNTATVLFDPTITDVQTITVEGSGLTVLGELAMGADPALTLVSVTGSGGVGVEINPATTSFDSTGSGTDVVSLYATGTLATFALGAGVTLTGGSGTSDVLYADFADSAAIALGTTKGISGFEILGVVGQASGTYDATDFKGLVVGAYDALDGGFYSGVAGDITFTSVAAGTPLDIIDSNGDSVTYSLATDTKGGSLSLTIGQDKGIDPTGTDPGTDGSEPFVVTLTGDMISTVAIHSQGFSLDPTDSNSLTLTDAVGTGSITTLTIDGDFAIGLIEEDETITSIDASGNTGAFVDLTSVYGSDVKYTVKGGAALLNVSGEWENSGHTAGTAGTSIDTYSTGSGGGIVRVGGGGAGDQIGQDTPDKANTGSETVNLNGATTTAGTIVVVPQYPIYGNTSDGGWALITSTLTSDNWSFGTFGSGALADVVVVGDTDVNGTGAIVPEIVGNAQGVSAGTDHYNISDGVFSLSSPDLTLTGTEEVNEVQSYIDTQADGTLGMVVAAVAGGSGADAYTEATFLIMKNGAGGAADTIVEITGVTTPTGFGQIFDTANPADPGNYGAGTSIMLGSATGGSINWSNVTAYLADATDARDQTASPGQVNGGSATVDTTYNDSGYMEDELLVSGAATTATFNSLGNWGVLHVDTTGDGDLVITQVGANPILLFEATGEVVLNDVTYGTAADNTTFVIDGTAGTTTIASLSDATNTGEGIALGGNYAITIGQINDTALTTIDASILNGFLDLGTATTPLTQSGSTVGLTILVDTAESGGVGGVVYASGDKDVIQFGSLNPAGDYRISSSGGDTIVAGGTQDQISAYGHYNEIGLIAAGGAGDTFNLGGSGNFDEGVELAAQVVAGDLNSANNALGVTQADVFDVFVSGGNTDFALTSTDVAAGANDTYNVGSATDFYHASDVVLFLGANSTVNLNGSACCTDVNYANLWLSSPTVGADVNDATTGTWGQETVNLAPTYNGYIDLFFYNAANEALAGSNPGYDFQADWANAEVNVASAASVGQALNIAASQAAVLDQQFNTGTPNSTVIGGTTLDINANTGLIDWFQYGGNTYIVEAVNNTNAPATHATLMSHDVVVELTGLHNPYNLVDLNGNHMFVGGEIV
jgi:hypothetical protein